MARRTSSKARKLAVDGTSTTYRRKARTQAVQSTGLTANDLGRIQSIDCYAQVTLAGTRNVSKERAILAEYVDESRKRPKRKVSIHAR